MLVIRLAPDHGHPSSLWGQPVRELEDPHRPYLLPEDFGITGALAQEILEWTDYFQQNFVKLNDDPDGQPLWEDRADVEGWNARGDAIVEGLAEALPDYEVEEGFSRYVRSANENRALAGLPRLDVPRMAIAAQGPSVRMLTQAEVGSRSFGDLMALATGAGEEKLERILCDLADRYAVCGVADGGEVVGFAAYDPVSDPVEIRYIAVGEEHQGKGIGAALVAAVRERVANKPIFAETDDDAVDFYRRLGFMVDELPRDPRWPQVQRYSCTLPADTSKNR